MAFWIFMFIMDLLIPISMIGFGTVFIKHPPTDINDFYGYRTSMSSLNKDTWLFAHQYFGRIWRKSGYITLFLTIVVFLFLFGKDTKTVSIYGGIFCAVQMIPLLFAIIPTERELRKHFTKDGRRKD